MEFIGSEIIVLSTSPAVLLSGAAVALVFLSGLAARALLYLEDLRHRWEARSRNPGSASARYRTHVVVEMGVVL